MTQGSDWIFGLSFCCRMYAKTFTTWDYLTCRNVWKMCCTQREDAATEPCCQNHHHGADKGHTHGPAKDASDDEDGLDNPGLPDVNTPLGPILHDKDNNKISYNSLDHNQTIFSSKLKCEANHVNEFPTGLSPLFILKNTQKFFLKLSF